MVFLQFIWWAITFKHEFFCYIYIYCKKPAINNLFQFLALGKTTKIMKDRVFVTANKKMFLKILRPRKQ